MAEISSPRWSWTGALKTTVRHTVMPLVAGSAVAALQTVQSGSFDVAAMKGAALTAVISGVVRWLQVFVSDTTVSS